MSLAAKKRLLLAALVAFALWPLAQFALVERYTVSPWRLFGWAMYCEPAFAPKLHLFAVEGGERVPLVYPGGTAAADQLRGDFLRDRRFLGSLAGPERLVAVVFEAYPEVTRLLVVVDRPYFEAAGARLRLRRTEYRFDRGS